MCVCVCAHGSTTQECVPVHTCRHLAICTCVSKMLCVACTVCPCVSVPGFICDTYVHVCVLVCMQVYAGVPLHEDLCVCVLGGWHSVHSFHSFLTLIRSNPGACLLEHRYVLLAVFPSLASGHLPTPKHPGEPAPHSVSPAQSHVAAAHCLLSADHPPPRRGLPQASLSLPSGMSSQARLFWWLPPQKGFHEP